MSDADAKTEIPVVSVPPRKVEPQNEMHFQEHGTKQMEYDAIAAPGVKPKDVLDRGYWAHVVGRSLRTMTKINIMADDRSWYGELIVMATYQQGALVQFVAGPIYLEKAGLTKEESEFEVFEGGISKKWCVRRIKDGRNIKEGCESRGEAEQFLTNYLKANGQRAA